MKAFVKDVVFVFCAVLAASIAWALGSGIVFWIVWTGYII